MLININLQSKMGSLARVVLLSVCLAAHLTQSDTEQTTIKCSATFISQSKYIRESWHSDTWEVGPLLSHSQAQCQILLFASHWHTLRLTILKFVVSLLFRWHNYYISMETSFHCNLLMLDK